MTEIPEAGTGAGAQPVGPAARDAGPEDARTPPRPVEPLQLDLGAAPPRGELTAVPPAAPDAAAAAGRAPRPIAHKEYYSISEVCDIVGLKPHVLRYWESQFPVLNPSKNRSGNRVYQRKEIKLVLLVRRLLYDEKYTIEGARQRLEQLRRGGELGQAAGRALDAGMLELLREELHQLLHVLSPGQGG